MQANNFYVIAWPLLVQGLPEASVRSRSISRAGAEVQTADGSGTAHGCLEKAEWEGMFFGCKHTTGIVNTITAYPKK